MFCTYVDPYLSLASKYDLRPSCKLMSLFKATSPLFKSVKQKYQI